MDQERATTAFDFNATIENVYVPFIPPLQETSISIMSQVNNGTSAGSAYVSAAITSLFPVIDFQFTMTAENIALSDFNQYFRQSHYEIPQGIGAVEARGQCVKSYFDGDATFTFTDCRIRPYGKISDAEDKKRMLPAFST